jgi:hypothetical protein
MLGGIDQQLYDNFATGNGLLEKKLTKRRALWRCPRAFFNGNSENS